MLSIGGTQEVGLTNQDPWIKGLGIFDMTTLSWTNAYDPAAPAYEQPSLVSQFYANRSRCPIAWGDPELQSIFTITMPNGTANVSGHSGGNSGSDSSDSSNSTNSSNSGVVNRGTVVGGVIGGIAALAITGSLIYWRLRLYKRKEKQRLQSRRLQELQGLPRFEMGGR
jgi:hypothetical protein